METRSSARELEWALGSVRDQRSFADRRYAPLAPTTMALGRRHLPCPFNGIEKTGYHVPYNTDRYPGTQILLIEPRPAGHIPPEFGPPSPRES